MKSVKGRKQQIDALSKHIKKEYGLSLRDLQAQIRAEDIVFVRFVAYTTLKEAFGWSNAEIAQVFKRERSVIKRGRDSLFSGKNKKYAHEAIRSMMLGITTL